MSRAISLMDLSPRAREQAAQQVIAQETRKRKFNNEPTAIDGHLFDSKKEANRYLILKDEQRRGLIGAITLQPEFDLVVNGILIAKYRGDFEYRRNDVTVIEDVKGMRTREFILKKKLMRAVHGIEVIET